MKDESTNTEQNSKSQPKPEYAGIDRHIDEVEAFKAFMLKHGLNILVGTIAGIAIVTAVSMHKSHKQKVAKQASELLFSARSIQDLESVTAKHPSSAYAPIAIMRLAKGYYDSGSYDLAIGKYAEFKQKFPKHELAPGCDLGKAFCLEAKGFIQEALTAYTAFSKEYPDNFLTPQAVFGLARCNECLGNNQATRTIYENFMAKYPESAWADKAKESLMQLNKKMKKTGGEQAILNAPSAQFDTPPKGTEPSALPFIK